MKTRKHTKLQTTPHFTNNTCNMFTFLLTVLLFDYCIASSDDDIMFSFLS